MAKKNKAAEVFVEAAENMLKALQEINVDTPDWRCPWNQFEQDVRNVVTNKRYRGMNWIFLGFSMWFFNNKNPDAQKFNNWWGTFKQWETKGRVVRKGETATRGIYYNTYEKTPEPTDEDPDPDPQLRFVSNTFALFNYAQTDAVTDSAWIPPSEMPSADDSPLRQQEIDSWVDSFCQKSGLDVTHSDSPSDYRFGDTTIQSANPDSFKSMDEYYSSLFYDITRATAYGSSKEDTADARTFRQSAVNFDANPEAQALEELTAELGSALLCSIAGVKSSPRRRKTLDEQKAALLRWQKLLEDDPKVFQKAVNQAQKAARLVEANSDVQFREIEEVSSDASSASPSESAGEQVKFVDLLEEVLVNGTKIVPDMDVADTTIWVQDWLAGLDKLEADAPNVLQYPKKLEIGISIEGMSLITANEYGVWSDLVVMEEGYVSWNKKSLYTWLLPEVIISQDEDDWVEVTEEWEDIFACIAGLVQIVGDTEVIVI